MKNKLSYGQRMADRIAAFGGSWTFIFLFFGILMGWIVLNAWILNHSAYDPYPFILLNLILSCLAAIQAPIIMMSQTAKKKKTEFMQRTITSLTKKQRKKLENCIKKWINSGNRSKH